MDREPCRWITTKDHVIMGSISFNHFQIDRFCNLQSHRQTIHILWCIVMVQSCHRLVLALSMTAAVNTQRVQHTPSNLLQLQCSGKFAEHCIHCIHGTDENTLRPNSLRPSSIHFILAIPSKGDHGIIRPTPFQIHWFPDLLAIEPKANGPLLQIDSHSDHVLVPPSNMMALCQIPVHLLCGVPLPA